MRPPNLSHVLILIALNVPALFAQGERIPAAIEGASSAALGAHRPPPATAELDRGPVPRDRQISYVSILFRRTAAQQADLEKLLAEQQNPASPDYRRWLTPAQFGDRFGLDPASLNRARAWLVTKGLSVNAVAASRNWIAFSGTAGQIADAFGTELRSYDVYGKMHYAPAREPSVPAALKPAVLAIRGLDDFRPEPPRRSSSAPALAGGNGGNYLSPADLAVLYGVAPLQGDGFNGTGQSIAIVGASNVNLDDLTAYRTKFGLPLKTPTLIAVPDPGIPFSTTDQGEASLDLEISAAIAPNADQIFVYASSSEDAARYAIDHDVAPVVSMSFISCEANFSQSGLAALGDLGQEAASMGITWVVSSGDAGPASCDRQDISGNLATHGISVNAYAAVPEVTAVGGTEFSEGNKALWNAVNAPNLASVAGPIPETVWNDTKTAGYLAASGGGASKYFSKPSWQAGLGVPSDGARDVPDIALSSSWLHDGYVICDAGNCNRISGGTSAATPLFAGMVVLLNQFLTKWGVISGPGLGNLNPMLYVLAQPPASSQPALGFHDIVTGDNIVPCASGSPDCETGSFGFSAGPGYDLATGLGSLDASQLFTAWLAQRSKSLILTTTMVGAPAPSAAGGSTVIVATVAATNGIAPAGTVSFTLDGSTLGSATLERGTNMSTAQFTVFAADVPPGMNTVTARYSGNSEYAPSSDAAQMTFPSLTASKPSVRISITPDPVLETPTSYGSSWNFTVTLREVNGVAADLTQLTAFKINGRDCLSDSADCSTPAILGYFGATVVPAFGSVSVPFTLTPGPPATPPAAAPQFMTLSAFASGTTASAKAMLPGLSAPAPLKFELDFPPVPPATTPNVLTAVVPLLGRPNAASIQLTGVPNAVLRTSASGCPWGQQLVLRELSGTGVNLKHFSGGGMDQSSSIAAFFGGTRLAPNSALTAKVCWNALTVPILIDYEIDGIDDNGNMVSAALASAYLSQATAPNMLSVASPDPSQSASALNFTGSAPVLLSVTASASQVWSVSVFTPGSTDAVKVSPISGLGPGNVLVTPVSGLSAGTYTATLMFQSLDAVPQVVSVPVTVVVSSP